MQKKIDALIKKGYTELKPWKRSIINHLHWCAATSGNDTPEMIVAKWKSVCNHIINKHEGHDDPLFPMCRHDKRDKNDHKKSWLKSGIYCDTQIKNGGAYKKK